MKNELLIEVQGGCVQCVKYTCPENEEVEVILIDWDNIEGRDEELFKQKYGIPSDVSIQEWIASKSLRELPF